MAVALITEPQSRHVYVRIGSEDLLLRPIRSSDRDAIRALLSEGATTERGEAVQDRFDFGVVAVGGTKLGEPEGAALGAAHFRRLTTSTDTAVICVGVAPHAWRRGIGTLLLRELAGEALDRGIERLRTEPGRKSDALFSLLSRFGRLKLRPAGVLELGLPTLHDSGHASQPWPLDGDSHPHRPAP